MKSISTLMIMLCSLLLSVCSPVAPDFGPNEEVATRISGVAINIDTRAVVAGAAISVVAIAGTPGQAVRLLASTTTDASGRYVLEVRTESPSVRIFLTKSGYNWCTKDYACKQEYITRSTGHERRVDCFISKASP